MTNKITFLARLFSVLSATFLAVSCESDDICDHTVNTPRLVVRFYNANNTRTPMSTAQPSILLHYLYGCKTLLPTFFRQ